MHMTQLIINGFALPKVSRDKYKCFPEEKGESMRMISGRLVTEVAYKFVVIEYNNDFFGMSAMRSLLEILRSDDDLDVEYLTPESDVRRRGPFKSTKRPSPTFAFSRKGVPFWHGIAFRLEGVNGID